MPENHRTSNTKNCQYGYPKGETCPYCERDAAFALADEQKREIERLQAERESAHQRAQVMMADRDRLIHELEEVRKYSVERTNLLWAVAEQGTEIQRLRTALERIAKDEPDYLAHAVARRALNGEPI